MALELLLPGPNFDIYAMVSRRGGFDYCPAQEFIAEMPEVSRKSLLNVLRQHAVAGPVLNRQESRLLEDGIYEFKSMQGDRLLYFYSPAQRRQTIITHGFHKGARLRVEIEHAKGMRSEYLRNLS